MLLMSPVHSRWIKNSTPTTACRKIENSQLVAAMTWKQASDHSAAGIFVDATDSIMSGIPRRTYCGIVATPAGDLLLRDRRASDDCAPLFLVFL
jgi:hypothetical protein